MSEQKKLGRPFMPAEKRKVKYNMYFSPDFLAELKAFAASQELTTSRLVEEHMASYMKRMSK